MSQSPDYKAVQELHQVEAKALQSVADFKQAFNRIAQGQIAELKQRVAENPNDFQAINDLMEHGTTQGEFVFNATQPVFGDVSPNVTPVRTPRRSDSPSPFFPPSRRQSIVPFNRANSPVSSIFSNVSSVTGSASSRRSSAVVTNSPGVSYPSPDQGIPLHDYALRHLHDDVPLVSPQQAQVAVQLFDIAEASPPSAPVPPNQAQQEQDFFANDTPVRLNILAEIMGVGAAAGVAQTPVPGPAQAAAMVNPPTPDTAESRGVAPSPPVASVQSPMTPPTPLDQVQRALTMVTPGTIARDLGQPLRGLGAQNENMSPDVAAAMEEDMNEALDPTDNEGYTRERRVFEAQEQNRGDPTFRQRFFGYGTTAALLAIGYGARYQQTRNQYTFGDL